MWMLASSNIIPLHANALRHASVNGQVHVTRDSNLL